MRFLMFSEVQISASKCPAYNLAFTIDEVDFGMAPYPEGPAREKERRG